MSIDIIICAFNNRDILPACLDAVMAQTHQDFRCFLMDDNSSDGTEDFVRTRYPNVEVIRNATNLGPSISRNLAIRRGSAPYVVTLDSDAIIPPHWLAHMVAFLEAHPYAGIAGSKLLFMDGRINAAGGRLTKLGQGSNVQEGAPADTATTTRRVHFACSAAMIIRRAMLEHIGLFDETYFYSYEDTDLGWRANLAGYEVWYVADIAADHRVSATMSKRRGRIFYHARKNMVRSLVKNHELSNLVRYLPLQLMGLILHALVRPPRRLQLRGLLDALRQLPDSWQQRQRVQSLRQVKDRDFFRLANQPAQLLPPKP